MGRIKNFNELGHRERVQATCILVEALAHVPSAWSDLESALEEVNLFINKPDRIALAVENKDQMVGWIGGIRHTAAAWELHPLVVDPGHQRLGFTVIGVFPDVNGLGKHDILMAKRIVHTKR